MNEKLQAYLASCDYDSITRGCIEWIRSWFAENGPSSPAVIGISGGKDSSVVTALCLEALGYDRVFGVLMPNGIQPDIHVSRMLVDHLHVRYAEINISESVLGVRNSIQAGGLSFTDQMTINLPPRIRMTTLYAVSQCMNGRVSNNCNRSENFVGYSTVFGDAAGDFSPLANLTVTEVKQIGRCLGLPEMFVEKPPSDGLTDRTDEDNFGFTYEDLDTYILTGFCPDDRIREMIEKRHKANLFKLQPMPEFVFDRKDTE